MTIFTAAIKAQFLYGLINVNITICISLEFYLQCLPIYNN